MNGHDLSEAVSHKTVAGALYRNWSPKMALSVS